MRFFFLNQKAFNKEIAKEISQNDEVENLNMEVVTRVAVWKDSNSTVSDDDSELKKLHDGNEWLDFVGDC